MILLTTFDGFLSLNIWVKYLSKLSNIINSSRILISYYSHLNIRLNWAPTIFYNKLQYVFVFKNISFYHTIFWLNICDTDHCWSLLFTLIYNLWPHPRQKTKYDFLYVWLFPICTEQTMNCGTCKALLGVTFSSYCDNENIGFSIL
jgi:hypothetical protein